MIRFLTTFISFSLFIWSPFQFSVDNRCFCFVFSSGARSLARLLWHALLNSLVKKSFEFWLRWCWKSTQKSFPWKCDAQEKERGKVTQIYVWEKATAVEPQSKSLAAAAVSIRWVKLLCRRDVTEPCRRQHHHISHDVMPWHLALDSRCQLKYTFHLFGAIWCCSLLLMVFIFLFYSLVRCSYMDSLIHKHSF